MSFRSSMKFLKLFKEYNKKGCKLCGFRAAFLYLMLISCFLILWWPSFKRPGGGEENVKIWTEDGSDNSTGQSGTNSTKPHSASKAVCDFSDNRSDFCQINGDIRIHGKSSQIFLLRSTPIPRIPKEGRWTIKPYARKLDSGAMANVKQLSIAPISKDEAPNCSLYHSTPALIFSTGGYVGNYFHDFSDVLVPLFITSRHLYSHVQLFITSYQPWWVGKYQTILQHLSGSDPIDLDRDDRVHCFYSASVGLRSHKEFSIDPSRSPGGYSMKDFTKFLRTAYSLEREQAISTKGGSGARPRLLIVSRQKTRAITNVEEVEAMAAGLGFEVLVMELHPWAPLWNVSRVVNSCDVLMGVHGAGLTNMVFLPANAVVVQVVPYGSTDWLSKAYFEEPCPDMNLRYLSYKIEVQESTLAQQYPPEHAVLKDPKSIDGKGWAAFRTVYLEKQNVTLNVGRLNGTLVKALQLLHQ